MALGRAIAALALLGTLAGQRGLEYEVKAAYLYNIVNFVTWPPGAFDNAADPLHVCVYGPDPFGRSLDNAMAGGTANNRTVQVLRVNDAAGLAPCEVVFLPSGNTDRVDQAIKATAARPVLTIGEAPDFLRRGGMIAFVIDGGRVRFDINEPAAMARGLTLSSRLLQVARTIVGRGAIR
ncbi:MAG TPA: YfiR family protein [Vicinamibacterales bacterium]|nr:YfiR family protein [Vicinamibacterales bacterium]